MKKSVLVLAFVALGALTACGQEAAQPKETTVSAVSVAPKLLPKTLPLIETANAEQFVQKGGALVPLDFAVEGETDVSGTVTGYAAPVYAVPVAQGQTLTVDFESTSPNLYMNISDAADHSGAALHRGEVEGTTATLTASRDMTFVITPFQPRAMARRNETADFSLKITRH